MQTKHQNGEFERGVVVGARGAGLSILETANLLEFSQTTISMIYREWSGKRKYPEEEKKKENVGDTFHRLT